MTSAKWIIKNALRFKSYIIILSIFNFVTAVVTVLFSVCFKYIIDCAENRDVMLALKFSVLLIGLVLLQIIILIFNGYIDEKARVKFGIYMRERLLSKLLYKEYKDISAYHTGEINNRFFSDVNIVTSNTIVLIPSIINMTVRLVASFVVMFFINKFFSVVFLVAGIICGICMFAFRGRMKFLHKDMQKNEGLVRSSIQETLLGTLLIKIFNAQKIRVDELKNRQAAYQRSVMRKKIYSCCANAGMNLAYNTGFLFAFFWGVFGILKGFLTYGSLTAVLQLTGQIQGSVSGMTGIVPTLYSLTASAERIMELENLPDEKEEISDITDISEIDIDNVNFSYGREEVLKDVSMKVRKGEITAILGISGAGKSTLFMLILGIYKPNIGEIRIISDTGKSELAGFSLRHLFSYVPQDNKLFSGSIRDNLMLAREVTDEEIHKALEIACAEFVFELPDRENTVIGENGMGLSEGQRQRIAIARAVLSEAPIIMFDEATSALDEETEKRLIKNLAEIKKTCLLITHRKSILSICNSSYIMEDGVLKKE